MKARKGLEKDRRERSRKNEQLDKEVVIGIHVHHNDGPNAAHDGERGIGRRRRTRCWDALG